MLEHIQDTDSIPFSEINSETSFKNNSEASSETNLANSAPLLSVIMPVYNVQKYIQEAVDSVLAQTFKDFELLIIDDESPDQSIAYVEANYDDPRIIILRQENRGLAGARNTGIRHARGRYVAFLDSDDFWQKDKLELHVSDFKANPNCGVSFSASMFVDEQSQPLGRLQTPIKKYGYSPRDVFCRNPIGNGSAPVIRKSVLEQIAFIGTNKHGAQVDYWQYFDESLKQSEDIDCWTRLSLFTGTEMVLIDKPLTNYRVNDAGLSADVDAQYATWMAFVNKISKSSPEFCKRHISTAKAYQCRYLARRCISQAQGRKAIKWMLLALSYQPIALFGEARKTLTTSVASLVLALLPKQVQQGLVARII